MAQQLTQLCEGLGPELARQAMCCSRTALNLVALACQSGPQHRPQPNVTHLPCRTELVPCFDKVLRDSEAEVRVAAAGKVAAFCKVLTADQVRKAHACSARQEFQGRLSAHARSACQECEAVSQPMLALPVRSVRQALSPSLLCPSGV